MWSIFPELDQALLAVNAANSAGAAQTIVFNENWLTSTVSQNTPDYELGTLFLLADSGLDLLLKDLSRVTQHCFSCAFATWA